MQFHAIEQIYAPSHQPRRCCRTIWRTECICRIASLETRQLDAPSIHSIDLCVLCQLPPMLPSRLDDQTWPLVVGCNNIVEPELSLSPHSPCLARAAFPKLPGLALGFSTSKYRTVFAIVKVVSRYATSLPPQLLLPIAKGAKARMVSWASAHCPDAKWRSGRKAQCS